MSDSEDDVCLETRKIERDTKKVGLREGISDGQEKNYQTGFDNGFKEGFRNAFAIGQYKAALLAKSHLDHSNNDGNEPLLKQPERGWCHMCTSDNFLNQTFAEISSKQTEITNQNLQTLHSKYSDRIKSTPNKLSN